MASVAGLHAVAIGALLHVKQAPTLIPQPAPPTAARIVVATRPVVHQAAPVPKVGSARRAMPTREAPLLRDREVPQPQAASSDAPSGAQAEIHGQLTRLSSLHVEEVVIRWALQDAATHTVMDLSLDVLAPAQDTARSRLAVTGAMAAGELRFATTDSAHWALFAQVAERLRGDPMLGHEGQILTVEQSGQTMRLRCLGERMLDLPGGQFAALLFANADGRSDEPILWLARGMNYALLQQRFEARGETWLLRVPHPKPL